MKKNLEEISGIGKVTADSLKQNGIDTVEKLANMDLKDLLKLNIKGVGKVSAKKFIENAKELMEESEEEIPLEKSEVQKTEKTEKPEKLEKKEKKQKKEKKEKKKVKVSESAENIKDLIKVQAECNIGLVGHVDHGIVLAIR